MQKQTIVKEEPHNRMRGNKCVEQRSRKPMQNVSSLVASITPQFKTVEKDGKLIQVKTGETMVLYPDRVCPVATRMTDNPSSF